MTHYDFHALLEPLEFQDLICDVVKIREGIVLEAYKEGPDQGMDGSFISEDGRTVLQAKRWSCNFNALKRALQNSELPKVKKLNPSRYILAVSMDFQPAQKQEIVDLFKGYIKATDDVISQKDVNLLLDKPEYHAVEMSYPKLWYASFQIAYRAFKQAAHAGSYQEIALELRDALETAAMYVPTRIYKKALLRFNECRVLVLTGAPGIGKTSMAQMLALSALSPQHMEGYIWANSIEEIYAHWDDAQRTVFILDDFWGSVFLKGKENQEERRLEKLIRRVACAGDQKRLILTTREYVLQQGLLFYPELRDSLERYVYICSMSDYDEGEKAGILYRHLYASALSYEIVQYLYEHSQDIVKHPNYNPRVLALFLERGMDADVDGLTYWKKLLEYFNEPFTFWENIYVKLSRDSQMVCMLLLISFTPMKLSDMEACYRKYAGADGRGTFHKPIGDCIAELEKTVIVTRFDEEKAEITLRFSVPAVQDYLYARLRENATQYAVLLPEYCCFYNQLYFLVEHLGMLCDTKIGARMIRRLLCHYDDYEDCIFHIDGSNRMLLDYDIRPHAQERLHRLFGLVYLYRKGENDSLRQFVEEKIAAYCRSMDHGNEVGQYNDLVNLPGLITRCAELNFKIPSAEVIEKYYQEAFSIRHYEAMREFAKVYPREYAAFEKEYAPQMKRRSTSLVYEEVEWLLDERMEEELELLLDSLALIYEELGWRCPKKIRKELYNMAEWPMPEEAQKAYHGEYHFLDCREKHSFEAIQTNARWILGPEETVLEDAEAIKMIRASALTQRVKAQLQNAYKNTMEYAFSWMSSAQTMQFFISLLEKMRLEELPQAESSVFEAALRGVCGAEEQAGTKLIPLLAECFCLFMGDHEPVVRTEAYLKSGGYQAYLLEDEAFRMRFENTFVMRDEQWIRFIHIPVFIYAYVLMNVMERIKGTEDAHKYAYLIKTSERHFGINEKTGEEASAYYAACKIAHFENNAWEKLLWRAYEELDTELFNREYVAPMIKELLDDLGEGDKAQKAMVYIRRMNMCIQYDAEGNTLSEAYLLDQCQRLMESLSVFRYAEPFSKKLDDHTIERLKRDGLLKKVATDQWELALERIEDTGMLINIIDWDELLGKLETLNYVHQKFLQGDFSKIPSYIKTYDDTSSI